MNTQNNVEFKAIFNKIISKNAFTLEEIASYIEHEWKFVDGESLPAYDVEPRDLKYTGYIGLKDKNGKKLYEFDIVYAETQKNSGIYVIEYHPESASYVFTTDITDKEAYSFRMSSKRLKRNIEDGRVMSIEKKGNLYDPTALINKI